MHATFDFPTSREPSVAPMQGRRRSGVRWRQGYPVACAGSGPTLRRPRRSPPAYLWCDLGSRPSLEKHTVRHCTGAPTTSSAASKSAGSRGITTSHHKTNTPAPSNTTLGVLETKSHLVNTEFDVGGVVKPDVQNLWRTRRLRNRTPPRCAPNSCTRLRPHLRPTSSISAPERPCAVNRLLQARIQAHVGW